MNPLLSGLLASIVGLIGRFVPDPEKKLEMQLEIARMAQAGELQELSDQVSVIVAEASGNFLQRSWRPIMMLFFTGLIGARWFGYSAPNMSENEILELWSIVKLGIGGYVVGRSVEKVIPSVSDAFKNK